MNNFKKRNREEMAQFLLDKVISQHFDFEDLANLEKCIQNADDALDAFCEFFEIGDWFYEAAVENQFDVYEFVQNFADEMHRQYEEYLKDCEIIEQDYRRACGWPV